MSLREQTRDRLGGCECGPGPMPGPVPLMPISEFEEAFYKTAYENGYAGKKKDFLEDFAALVNQTRLGIPCVISQCGSSLDFPDIGSEGVLYFDTEKKRLYLWDDKKGYIQAVGSSGSGGSITEEDVYDALDGKVVFSGGNALNDF